MNLHDVPSETAGSLEARPRRRDVRRIPRRWLLPVRVVWVLLALFSVGLFVANIPSLYTTELHGEFLTNSTVRANLASFGFSVEGYATIQVALRIATVVLSCVVGTVIFWRTSDELMALFVAFLLVTFATMPDTEGLKTFPTALALPAGFLRFIVFATVPLFFFLFPDGRFVPHWTRWVAVWWVVSLLLSSPDRLPSWLALAGQLAFLGILGSFAFAPIYRYVRVADPIQRQQMKWVVFGVAAGALSLIFLLPFQGGTLPYVAGQIVAQLALLSIPLSIGIAVLRYRLWDVDPIINRALVYGLLTVLLALIYISSVIALQFIFRTLTGQNSQLAIVASTLAIAALFNPLRRRIQAFIDRRFYRRKYDATQVLAAFAATARDEVDLDKLTAELVHVVEETLQPAHVSLWLREPERKTGVEGGQR